MANSRIFPCPDCAIDVSKSAMSCPHCGCPLRQSPLAKPAQIVVKQKKDLGCGGLVVVGFLAMFIYGMFSGIGDDLSSTAPKVPVVPKTAEELRIDKISKSFSAWDGSHYELSRWVKKRLKDPDSYEHIESRYNDKGDHLVVSLQYRAKNSFGGYSLEYVTAKVALDGAVLEILSQP